LMIWSTSSVLYRQSSSPVHSHETPTKHSIMETRLGNLDVI
jgi:hypothetical protein